MNSSPWPQRCLRRSPDARVDDQAIYVNERRVPLVYYRSRDNRIRTTLLPIVGGWRHFVETQQQDEQEALARMREEIEKRRARKTYVVLREQHAHWSPHAVIHAYVAGCMIGYVPEDRVNMIEDRTLTHILALLSFRGQTVYGLLIEVTHSFRAGP